MESTLKQDLRNTSEEAQSAIAGSDGVSPSLATKAAPRLTPKDEYTDGRKPWEWTSKFPSEARAEIKIEARILVGGLLVCVLLAGGFLALGNQVINFSADIGEPPLVFSVEARLVALFFTGCVGGITFSIKWLVHAAATGRWHQDRRYWRLLIPCLGGVYALAVLALANGGYVGGQTADPARFAAASPALAFLIGYFSDGVSGLLSNIANAVFGTLEKK
ncbi:hypothetical protein [Marinibacterium sp. SX1]|uniref:hypothetical protein n=1 Tax=Marinibacterium sp. SX1 TaxID=3388424 RepID=UPI003D1801C7